MSSLKPIIELESKYALIKPKDDSVYVPFFKRNHNKSRLTQLNNHIKYSSGNIKNTKI